MHLGVNSVQPCLRVINKTLNPNEFNVKVRIEIGYSDCLKGLDFFMFWISLEILVFSTCSGKGIGAFAAGLFSGVTQVSACV